MVTVRTSAGAEFAADHAVVTVPVGVLQSADLTIEPALPERHAAALSRLRMNAFEKVFLRFSHRFWDEGVYAIRQQGPEGAWWHSWYDLTPLHDSPTLLTFAAGPAAVATRAREQPMREAVRVDYRSRFGQQRERRIEAETRAQRLGFEHLDLEPVRLP